MMDATYSQCESALAARHIMGTMVVFTELVAESSCLVKHNYTSTFAAQF